MIGLDTKEELAELKSKLCKAFNTEVIHIHPVFQVEFKNGLIVTASEHSEDWDKVMYSVIYFEEDFEGWDFHCQTGDHYEKCFQKTNEILKTIGLEIDEIDIGLASSGIYSSIKRLS